MTTFASPCARSAARLVCQIVAALALAAPSHAQDARPPGAPTVADALTKAGANRAEIEKVIAHYEKLGDAQKLEAARFLIANMIGQCYIEYALFDEKKAEHAYDALDHKDFAAAQARLDELEKQFGPVDFQKTRYTYDLQTITADYLIENIELAFAAWKSKPWARDLSFEAFRDYVLPYRGSNEPLGAARRACLERTADVEKSLKTPADVKEAAAAIRKAVDGWMGFNEIFYLHPTDQSYDEMSRRKLGRCEDIANMCLYALRANAIPAASDFTPYWADRDNNHAWEVILDAQGRGKAGLSNRAAKIYRKTYATQPDSLGVRLATLDDAPGYINSSTIIDVTTQYVPTSDVNITLVGDAPAGQRFAYVCVFNGGEWRPIAWCEPKDGAARFAALGRNIAYLPAWWIDRKVVPGGPPFILSKDGEVQPLIGADSKLTIELSEVVPKTPDADTRRDKPQVQVQPGKTYELFSWQDGWQSQGKRVAGAQPVAFDDVPGGRLYWVVEEGGRKLERIFTVSAGRQTWW